MWIRFLPISFFGLKMFRLACKYLSFVRKTSNCVFSGFFLLTQLQDVTTCSLASFQTFSKLGSAWFHTFWGQPHTFWGWYHDKQTRPVAGGGQSWDSPNNVLSLNQMWLFFLTNVHLRKVVSFYYLPLHRCGPGFHTSDNLQSTRLAKLNGLWNGRSAWLYTIFTAHLCTWNSQIPNSGWDFSGRLNVKKSLQYL